MRTYLAGTKVEQFNGIDIYLDTESGSFMARVGQKIVRRKALAELRRLIGRLAVDPVALVSLPWWLDSRVREGAYHNTVREESARKLELPRRHRVVEVVTQDGHERYRSESGDLIGNSDTNKFYHDDPVLYAEIEALRAERDETVKGFVERYVAILARYRPFEGFPKAPAPSDGRILPKKRSQT